jgi:hypothetical protein
MTKLTFWFSGRHKQVAVDAWVDSSGVSGIYPESKYSVRPVPMTFADVKYAMRRGRARR